MFRVVVAPRKFKLDRETSKLLQINTWSCIEEFDAGYSRVRTPEGCQILFFVLD